MIWSSGRTWTIWLTLYSCEAKTLFEKGLISLFPASMALSESESLVLELLKTTFREDKFLS